MFKTLAIRPQEANTENRQTKFLSLTEDIRSMIFSLLNKDGQLQLAITCKSMCTTFRKNIFVINPNTRLNLPGNITIERILNQKKPESLPPIANIAKKSIYIKAQHLNEFIGLLQNPDNPFKELRSLYLSRTNITDEGLKEIAKLTELSSLYLSYTNITAEELEELRKALPNCNIIT